VGGAIRLWQDGERLHFEVSDEGVGFSQEEIIEPGQGLMNMRDRMEAAGGTVAVSSRRGHGTVVRGWVPISSRTAARLGSA
jgi:signal transduction histidine kinase